MGKVKFKTIEEAQSAFDALEVQKKDVDAKLVKVQGEHDKLKTGYDTVVNELNTEKTEHLKTQEIATEAINKINETPVDANKLTAKIDGETYEVKFGVDGLTKEELAKDKAKLSLLLSGGSGALAKVEGK